MTKLRMTHRAEVSAGGEDDRAVTVTCSTETLGRDDIVLVSSGIELDRYRQNPVWLWQHNPDWPIARAAQIDIQSGNLVARVQFPPAGVSERADEILGLIRAGVVNAASTGFETIEAEPIDPKDPRGGVRITRCELHEVSFVSIPAVPDALISERAIEEVRRMARVTRATEDWRCGADRDLPLDEKDSWDGEAAAERIFKDAGFDGDNPDPDKAKRGFLVYNVSNEKEKGGYKLPFADIVDGEMRAIRGGLDAAAQRLDATDIPDDERKRAQDVIDHYKAKETPDDQRALQAKIRTAFVKRGLWEVANLAYLLEEVGWVHDCAQFEADIEQDGSKVPAMLGDALKQLGEALVAMTAEEVQEMLSGVDVEVAPDPDVGVDERSLSPRVRAFRRGVRRAAGARRSVRPETPKQHSMREHRRMAELYARELNLSA